MVPTLADIAWIVADEEETYARVRSVYDDMSLVPISCSIIEDCNVLSFRASLIRNKRAILQTS